MRSDLLAGTEWDVLVIGAGPAGSLAATIGNARTAHAAGRCEAVPSRESLRRVPQSPWCRRELHAAGVERVLDTCGAIHVDGLRWIVGRQQARLMLPDMRVVDRALFDDALASDATRAGAVFLDGVQAFVEPTLFAESRSVTLLQQAERETISARVVIAADGLARSSLKRMPEFHSRTVPDSRIGVGVTVPHDGSLPRNEITMVVGGHGYVGLAASHGDRLHVAAALDPRAIAKSTIANLISQMLSAAGVCRGADWSAADWHGTPQLTSRPSHVAGERLFVIGDASGYVEPFSGEGMATALETALAVTPLAVAAARDWRPAMAAEWESIQRTLVVESQATCRQLAWILRHGWVAAAAIGLCRAQPWVARRFIRKVS